jgi:hypothetical protein
MTGRDREPLTPTELSRRIVITVAEYSATFLTDERVTRREIREGKLAALQIGNTWRILAAPLLPKCGLADPDALEIDLEDSEAASATDTAARSDLRPLKAIRHGNFDPPGA